MFKMLFGICRLQDKAELFARFQFHHPEVPAGLHAQD
jgi:hypothetical protein